MNGWHLLPDAGWWLVKSSAQAAVLVLVVLAVQWLFRRRLPAKWRHALWWLVVIRLLLPVTPSSGLSLFHWAGWPSNRMEQPLAAPAPARLPSGSAAVPLVTMVPSSAVPTASELPVSALVAPPTPDGEQPRRGLLPEPIPAARSAAGTPRSRGSSWPLALGWLWMAGVGVLAARLGFVVVRMRRALAEATPLADPVACRVLDQSCEEMGVRCRPRLYETAAVTSPALCGLWRPRLLLPPGLVGRFSAEELRLVFLHELAHLRRRDIAVNWLTTILQILHWFNPLLWLAFHRMRADSELACDARALSVAREGEQRAYGQTIIKLLEGATRSSVLPGVVGILEEQSQMKHRIRMIARFRPSRGRAGVAALAAVVLGWVCLTDAPAAKTGEAKATADSGKRTASASTPEPGSDREVRVGADPAPTTEGAPYGTRSLTVMVLDAASGRPLAGTEVYVGGWGERGPRRLTDDNGTYRFNFALPPAESRRPMSNFSVNARHPEFAPRSVMWTASGGDVYAGLPDEVTLRLERGITIGGLVQDERGAPLPGVRVLLSGSDYHGFIMGTEERETHEYPELSLNDPSSPAAVTDGAGRWSYGPVPSDLEFISVTLVRPDGAREAFTTSPREVNVTRLEAVSLTELRATNAVLKLPDGLTVRGVVVDEAGQPLAGVTVKEGYGQGNIARVSELTTGPDGRFERPHRVARQWIYTAAREDRATVSVVAQVEPGMGEVRIVLPPARPLRIEVVDETGKPLPDVQLSADPYRTEAQILDWAGTTDATGAAIWSNPPTGPATLNAASKALPAYRKFKTVPGEAERCVVLRAGGTERINVRVKALDASTRQPVKVGAVSANYEGGFSPFRSVAEPGASEFSVTLNRADVRVGMSPSYRLKLEAAGYEPLLTGSYDFDEGDQELELSLRRGGGPAEWLVLQPNGEPAADARCWVRATTTGNTLFINAPGRYYGDGLAQAQADAQGRLKLPSAPPEATVVVAHPNGFLAATVAALQRREAIQLEPYGGVEGRVLVAGEPRSAVNVSITPLAWSPSLPFHLSYTTTTGTDGGFRFTQVPTGEYKLYRWQMPMRTMRFGGTITETCQWPLTVRAGETNQVTYAFRGRPLVGQAVADPADAAVDWQNDVHVLALKVPPGAGPQRVNREDYATLEAFRKANDASFSSNARLAEARTARTYQLSLEQDGGFRVEDVPPGTYELRIRLTKPTEGTRASPLPRPEDEIGTLTREVVVAEGSGPLDLGTVTVGIKAEALGRKSVPMDFTAETLDGKPLRLSEIAGPRLVVFWAAWSERSREALDDLQRLRRSLEPRAGLTLVGVSLDDEAGTAAGVVRESSYDWLQARLSAEERVRFITAFDVTQLPTIFLVDSSGRVVNRDLEGERLSLAVKRLLAQPK